MSKSKSGIGSTIGAVIGVIALLLGLAIAFGACDGTSAIN